MARGKMDQELLALGRASKHIEELDDPRAQSRVATYLMMRYTAAGEQNLPSEERAKHFRASLGGESEADPRQLTIPGTAPGPVADAAPTRPATPPDDRPATNPATPPVAGADDPAAHGESGTEPDPAAPEPTFKRRAKIVSKPEPLVGLNDTDEEVEVEI